MARVYIRSGVASAVLGASVLLGSCGDPADYTVEDQDQRSVQDRDFGVHEQVNEALQVSSPPLTPTATAAPPLTAGPCIVLAAYAPFKVNDTNPEVTYTRPSSCPGWSGLEAEFTATATLKYRKLYVMAGFEYAGLPNPAAKCAASRVEFETYRRTDFNGYPIWLPTSIRSMTPIWSGEVCYWHNFNFAIATQPGVLHERIRARGIRFDGQIDNAYVGARLQPDSVP